VSRKLKKEGGEAIGKGTDSFLSWEKAPPLKWFDDARSSERRKALLGRATKPENWSRDLVGHVSLLHGGQKMITIKRKGGTKGEGYGKQLPKTLEGEKVEIPCKEEFGTVPLFVRKSYIRPGKVQTGC